MLAISLPLYPPQYLVCRKCSVTIVSEYNYCLRDLYSLPYSQSFYLLVFSFASILYFSSPLVPSVLPTPHKLSLPPTRTIAVANLASPLAESQNSSQRELSKNSNLSPLFSCTQPLSGFLFIFNQNHLFLPGLPDPVWSGPGLCFGLMDTPFSLLLCPPAIVDHSSSSHLRILACICCYHCSEYSSSMSSFPPIGALNSGSQCRGPFLREVFSDPFILKLSSSLQQLLLVSLSVCMVI